MTAAEPNRRPWLAEARERTGRSQEALARHLGVSAKTVSWWERGISTPRAGKRADLADALGFTLDELADRLGLSPAPGPASFDGGGAPGTFASITGWLSMFVRAEQAAQRIWTLVMATLPALCQTPGYARAVEATGHRPFTPGEIDRLVDQRISRAAVLESARYTALIAAPLIDATKGDPPTMADQMRHLLDLADRPNVTLRIIDVEHLTASPGEFTLLATGGPEADLATEGGVNGDRLEEGPWAVVNHVRLFDHLASLARDPETSRAVIARSADRFAALANTVKGTR